MLERTAKNRVIFGADTKKKKSRNPHGYWIFRWRSGWDSNPRAREDYLISSQARYDHFDTAPYMFSRRFPLPFSSEKGLWKELTERTANLFNFRTVENPHGYKVFGGRNEQPPRKISSQARYDHFDTLPILLCAAMPSCNAYYFTGFSGKSQVFSVKKVDNDGHKRLKYTVYYLRAADGAARRRAFARFCFGK